ncbi:MAG: hypothetical protein V1735_04935 [Nanoarchaeota archaeon]
MSHKLSISVDANLLQHAEQILSQKSFRNRSHLFEVALIQLMEDDAS